MRRLRAAVVAVVMLMLVAAPVMAVTVNGYQWQPNWNDGGVQGGWTNVRCFDNIAEPPFDDEWSVVAFAGANYTGQHTFICGSDGLSANPNFCAVPMTNDDNPTGLCNFPTGNEWANDKISSIDVVEGLVAGRCFAWYKEANFGFPRYTHRVDIASVGAQWGSAVNDTFSSMRIVDC